MNRCRYSSVDFSCWLLFRKNVSTFLLGRFNSVQLHLYISDFVNITYRCHLLPRFPPLLYLVPRCPLPRFQSLPLRNRWEIVYGYYRKSPLVTGLLRGPISNHYDHPFPQTGAHNSKSKLASQIEAKLCRIQRWFALTFYGNMPSPYPSIPESLKQTVEFHAVM